MRRAHNEPRAGAVAGRTCDGDAVEPSQGADAIGLLLPNGELTGHFAADPGEFVDIHHGIGANMSFKREVLAQLGGFRDDFPGTALREDSDIFLRVRALGYRAVFAPDAVVDHVGAPHVRGQRFDFRYMFWARHNHMLLLARNLGLGSPVFRHWVAVQIRGSARPSDVTRVRWFLRQQAARVAVVAGLANSLRKAHWLPTPPQRADRTGRRIQAALLGGPKTKIA